MTIRWRLLLDLLGLGLMIACLAYWWLDNLAHEVLGTVFLGLILVHNVFNRRRWPATVKPRRDAAWAVNLIPILGLAVSMSVMLVTSVLISRDLFVPLAVAEGEALRTIHRFTAYWALAFAGFHLGTRWGVVMNACRSALGLKPNVWRSLLLRGVAFAIVLKGIGAFAEMGLGAKLAWRFSLDMWDFSADAPGFFLNYLAITGAFAAVTHYGLMLLRASGRPSGQLARWQ